MSLVPYDKYPQILNTPDDLDVIVKDNQLKPYLDAVSKRYVELDVEKAMVNLTQVGSFLQLAYAGSKGFPCSTKIIGILSNYQGLVVDSYAASTRFVDISLQALKFHKLALVLAGKNPQKAVEMISKTGEVAQQMVTLCQELVDKSQKLCDEAKDALVAASNDESVTYEKRRKIQEEINNLEAQNANLKTMTKDLETIVLEQKEKERQYEKQAQDARHKAFVVGIIGSLMNPVAEVGLAYLGRSAGPDKEKDTELIKKSMKEQKKANTDLISEKQKLAVLKSKLENEQDEAKKQELKEQISVLEISIQQKSDLAKNLQETMKKVSDDLGSQAQSLVEKEANAAKIRLEKQKELIDANAKLSETISKLKTSSVEKNDLDTSIHSLEVTVSTLGKVKTIFENARLFWKGVHSQCKSLTDVTEVEAYSEIGGEDFINSIKSSGFNWICLAKTNRIASVSMKSVNESLSSIMNNLPSKSEALSLIENLVPKMIAELQDENEQILKN